MANSKLVRDRVPEIIESTGRKPVMHVAGESEYRRRLLEKLHEEVDEFCEKKDVEELADVLEVIAAICGEMGISLEELNSVGKRKLSQKGGFSRKIVLEEITAKR